MAVASQGLLFRRWSGTAWANIANVTSVSGPNLSRTTLDTTTLDTTGGYETFIGSFRNGGDVKLTMLYDYDSYLIMKNDFESDVERNYEVIAPDTDTSTWNISGLVTNLDFKAENKGLITADTTIKISGAVDFNTTSGS